MKLVLKNLKTLSILLSYTLLSQNACSGVTAEQILGEYWNDPLFGEAASETTVSIELLPSLIWPNRVTVPVTETVRFVFTNKSIAPHLIAFSYDINKQLEDKRFQNFIKDEVYHSKQQGAAGAGHSHSGATVGDAESLVKTLAQWPTVFVLPEDKKEILIRFDNTIQVSFTCVLESHQHIDHKGLINVVDTTDFKRMMK